MKKYLFRTVLVLAALTACNKEIDNQTPLTVAPVDETPTGKVTLTFKATVGEDTRTFYANDKTGAWEAGDEITVCVTNRKEFEIVDFTTEDGETFSAEVSEGFTTIASAVYPANDAYGVSPGDYFNVMGDGDVIGLYLTNVLDLGLADDKGTLIPMVGSIDADTQTMSFHHVCGALKVTLSNIPDDASIFTFHANNQQLVFDFPLTSDGRIELGTPVEGNDDMDLFFNFTVGDETTRSFYIPIPDGSLAAGSYVTLENEDGELLYKKVLSTAQTFDKNVIKRLPTAECWTKNEDWNAYYFGPYKSSGKIYKRICLENMTGSYNYEVLTNSQFNDTYHGSAADYLSSTHFSTIISGLTTSYSSSGLNLNYNTLPKGKYYVMLFGLDQNLKFTGEYNCVEVVNPTFSTPEGWSISVVDDYKVAYTVPDGTKWQYVSVTASDFETTYLGHLEYLIYKGIRDRKGWHEQTPSSWGPRTGTLTTISSTANEGDYIYLCIGIDENYRPTGEYCRLDYSFETPTDAYSAWLGEWTVSDGTNNDTWKISRRQANHSYTITGIAGQTYKVLGEFEDGTLKLSSQLLEEKYGSNKKDIYLLTRGTSGVYSSMDRLILTATMDDEGAVTVTPSTGTSPGGYGIYWKGNSYNTLGARTFSNPISMNN